MATNQHTAQGHKESDKINKSGSNQSKTGSQSANKSTAGKSSSTGDHKSAQKGSQGFASMSKDRVREIASKGGKSSQGSR